MNILYWNIKNNSNIESIISNCLIENDIDIALLSEYNSVDFNCLLETVGLSYEILQGIAGCEKVKVIYKNKLQLSIVQEQHRYLIMELVVGADQYFITGVHLPSNPYANSDDRKDVIRNIMQDISESEAKYDTEHNSIVIGDMNASPFDSEMVNKNSFNAVLFKKLIEKNEMIEYHGDNYERFYNPILEYVGETLDCYGSFYYSSGIGTLYWYCFDQVLVRKSLINKIKGFTYLKQIGEIGLIKDVAPDSKISDHLPLLVQFEI